jgi:ribosomal protein L11 methyltransferase
MINEEYTRYIISVSSEEQKDILVALLAEWGIEGFEEGESELFASGKTDEVDKGEIEAYLSENEITFTKEVVVNQNWNTVWESNFQPIQVDDFVGVRADFHAPFTGVEYEIVITPKMSFGTGHHATTFMMMQLMRMVDFKEKTVFDFGTGTGILAILAEKLGAKNVLAADNDDWCIENANENVERNNCQNIDVEKKDCPPAGQNFDIVLANINRNIILENFSALSDNVLAGNKLLLSGLLVADGPDILAESEKFAFKKLNSIEKNGWIALLLEKSLVN